MKNSGRDDGEKENAIKITVFGDVSTKGAARSLIVSVRIIERVYWLSKSQTDDGTTFDAGGFAPVLFTGHHAVGCQ